MGVEVIISEVCPGLNPEAQGSKVILNLPKIPLYALDKNFESETD
jgi:hypothetical protein